MKISLYKKIGFLILCTALIGLIYLAYVSVDRSNKISLEIDFIPEDAVVSIDGHRVKRGVTYLDPGTYEVKASREGFSDYTDSSLILNDSSTERFYTIKMTAESDEAKEWLSNNQESVNRITKLGYKMIDERNEYFSKKNPIANHLPYKSFLYSIGHYTDPTDPEGIIITIDAGDGYRQAALYRIRQLGFDPTDFNIIFRDYENPFPL